MANLKNLHILVIDDENIGKAILPNFNEKVVNDSQVVPHFVGGNQLIDDSSTFKFKAIPRLNLVPKYINTSDFNYKKHKETCAKNTKARKRKGKRK